MKRFALLIGVNVYSKTELQLPETGEHLSINDLKGCVNDVKEFHRYLRNKFNPDQKDIHILTSPPPEGSNELPTSENIMAHIDMIHREAHNGDMFIFYFAGHGHRAQSKSIDGQLARSSGVPSLLPMDCCCLKGTAIRGWQLNDSLKRFNDKNIKVVVILDSCYAAAAWERGDDIDTCPRTPKGWRKPVDLHPIGEYETQKPFHGSNDRDCRLEFSWDINPKDFTLMAACKEDETAGETCRIWAGSSVTQHRGRFTQALLAYLDEHPSREMSTYRVIRNNIEKKIKPQIPQVFGRDTLVFLQDEELSTINPISIDNGINQGRITLPIGKVHGVKMNAEFTPYPSMPDTAYTFEIVEVGDHNSRARIQQDPPRELGHFTHVRPSRWSFKNTLEIHIGSDLSSGFRATLRRELCSRIVGEVAFVNEGEDKFGVKSGEDGINVFYPNFGLVHGLEIREQGLELQVKRSALALAHLFRFHQVHNLKTEMSKAIKPFNVVLEVDSREPFSEKKVYDEKEVYKLTFKNNDKVDLYFTVVNLGPGYHVQQLYPTEDATKRATQGQEIYFHFFLTIPEELKKKNRCHRDIIRTIVTKDKFLPFKSLELPHIWNAEDKEDRKIMTESKRDGSLVEELAQVDWWVHDTEIRTKLRQIEC